jgi:glycosyltransferase involved in cell wall biosynthesis
VNIVLVATKAITINQFLTPFIERCINKGDNLTILCKNTHELHTLNCENGINLIEFNFPSSISEIFNPIQMICKIIKLRGFIIAHRGFIFYTHTPISSHMLRISSIFLNVKLVYHVHGFRFHGKGKKVDFFFKMIEVLLSRFTTKFIAINKEDYDFIDKDLKKDVSIVHGVGVDIKKLKEIFINTKKANKNIVIGVVGAYKKEKGYDDILDLIKIFKTNKKIEVHCYGYGDQSRFLLKTADLDIMNNIDIHFHCFSDNILKIISEFDLLIHPSRREGLPVSVMEAMCLGVPIIATNIRGCRDLINDKIDGRLYPPKDVHALNAILGDFLKNKDKYDNYAKLAQSKCIKNFDAKEKAKEMYGIVGEVYES